MPVKRRQKCFHQMMPPLQLRMWKRSRSPPKKVTETGSLYALAREPAGLTCFQELEYQDMALFTTAIKIATYKGCYEG